MKLSVVFILSLLTFNAFAEIEPRICTGGMKDEVIVYSETYRQIQGSEAREIYANLKANEEADPEQENVFRKVEGGKDCVKVNLIQQNCGIYVCWINDEKN